MGTPQFAVPSLEALINSRHDIVAVVTVADKRAGRKLKVRTSEVKQTADRFNIPVLQPMDLKDVSFIGELTDLRPAAGVVVAFRILPPEVYNIPDFGCINLHASLLPDLRGAAPINWALMRGYTRTGVTTFQIEKGVDTGKILLQDSINIASDDNAGTISERLSTLGANLLIRTLDMLEDDSIEQLEQKGNHSRAPKITKDICKIDWSRPAVDIHNQVRGLSPIPGAFTIFHGQTLKLFRTEILDEGSGLEPGSVSKVTGSSIFVQAGSGTLELTEVQIEGRRRMIVADFLRGKEVQVGTKLG